MKQFKSLIKIATFAACTLLGLTAGAESLTTDVSVVKNGRESVGVTFSEKGKWVEATPQIGNSNVAEFSNGSSNGNTTTPHGTVTGKGAGWTSVTLKCSNNDTWTINVTVTDSKAEEVTLKKGEQKTIECKIDGARNDEVASWQVLSDDSNVVTVTGDASSVLTFSPTLTAVGCGTTTVTVKNNYVTYTYNVEVKKQEVIDPNSRTVYVGESITLPAVEGWGSDWQVSSTYDNVVVSKVNGGVTVTGKANGSDTVVVEGESAIYTYTIDVLKHAYGPLSVSVPLGGGNGLTLDEEFDGFESVVMTDEARNMVEYRQSGKKITLFGLGLTEYPVQVVVETKAATYTYDVTVQEIVRRTVQLATGAEGTLTTHEESFVVMEGKTLSVSVSDTSVVTVTTDGNKVTFAPVRAASVSGEPREATVTVENVTIGGVERIVTYTVKVTDYESGLKQFDGGFVAYTGVEPTVATDNGDLLLVFNQSGTFTIPSLHEATMTVLAVGGGGAGGSQPDVNGNGAAGGGAGGFVLKENLKLVGATYTVTVGAGGQVRQDVGEGPVSGLSGGNSTLSVGEFAYVSAIGGGGGGAPDEDDNDGFPGGSSGGAAWFGMTSCGDVGEAVDGQGWSGAKPSFLGNGGGGGGASGGASEFTGGAGKASSLGGSEVVYAKGGNGWDYMNGSTKDDAGKAGVNPGDGGNAGWGSKMGGAGKDGVVIVRISNLEPVVLVPVPTERDILDLRHQWAAGVTYSGLATEWRDGKFISPSDGNEHTWGDAVERVYFAGDHETVTCTTGTNGAKEGIGYYNFTFYLKDGYAWADGSLTEEKSFRWSIVENLDNPDANIGIDKTVSPMDKDSKATVTIDTFSSPEMMGKSELNVLFIGTACPNHGLKASTISKSLNVILEKANVSYYLFTLENLRASGTASMGDRFSDTYFSDAMGTGGDHKSLSAFYDKLYDELLAQKNEYDYIVFEIDGSRVAAGYTRKNDHEAAVAEALKPYYKNKKVIWIVDNPDTRNDVQTHFPAEIGRLRSADDTRGPGDEGGSGSWSDGKNSYWRPNSYFFNTSNNDNNFADSGDEGDGGFTAYRGLVGMFDPEHYDPDATGFEDLWTAKAENVTRYRHSEATSMTWTSFTSTYYAVDGIENQAMYDDPEAVTMMLARSIKPKAYNFRFEDAIAAGLSLETVTVKVCSVGANGIASKDDSNWHEVMVWDSTSGEVTTRTDELAAAGIPEAGMTVDVANRAVNAVYWNIDFPLWTKVDIGVSDKDGAFRKAVVEDDYNATTERYEKNPNNGRAHAWLTTGTEGAEADLNVEGYADTLLPWSFDLYEVTGEAVNGTIYVGNTAVQKVSAVPGDTVVVTFRGDPGYVLESVEIDGVLQDVDFTTKSVTLENIQKNHHVKVVYKKYEAQASLVSLWISDHADAGSKFVHLAFVPTLKIGDGAAKDVTAMTADEREKAWAFFDDVGTAGGISVIIATTSADLDSGKNVASSKVNLRRGWDRDFTTKGWVWVTVPSRAEDVTAGGMYWKIVIQQPGGEQTVSE